MKIKRFRETQETTFEDFFNKVTDEGICRYCESYQDCMEAMGADNIEAISGNGCGGFDASVDDLKKAFLLEKCVLVGT